jgi:hypothetical protein
MVSESEEHMGLRASQATIKRHLKKMANKYPGVEFQVLYASNGETAILPVNPTTGKPEATNPQVFVVEIAKRAVKVSWEKMCAADGIDPTSKFVVFKESNPHFAEHNKLAGYLMDEIVKLKGGCQ